MRIALYSPQWPYGQNGIISYARNLGQGLAKLEHSVIILTPEQNGYLGFEQVVQLPQGGGEGIMSRALRKIRKLAGSSEHSDPYGDLIASGVRSAAKKFGLDVFEIEESFGWCGTVATSTLVPVIARLHGPWFLNGPFSDGEFISPSHHRVKQEKIGIQTAAVVTAPSQQVLSATNEYYGISPNAYVIPNPVYFESTWPTWTLEGSAADSILYVGRTDNRKGGDLVLRAFELLLRTRPSLQLHFVGPDTGFVDSSPGTTFSQYIETRFEPAVSRQTIYYGPLAPADIAPLRLRCRITIVLSRYENFPMVCMEAMVMGCPLVASRVGGIPEMVKDNETGVLVDIDRLADIVEKIGNLLDDEVTCAAIGQRASEVCRDQYAPVVVAQRTVDLYQSLL